MKAKPQMWFSADFQCSGCGSILGIETYQAIIDGPGLEVACRHCRTHYVVTRQGATPMSNVDLQNMTTTVEVGDSDAPRLEFKDAPKERPAPRFGQGVES